MDLLQKCNDSQFLFDRGLFSDLIQVCRLLEEWWLFLGAHQISKWPQQIDALHIFIDLFDSIIKSFDEVTSNPSKWSRDSLVDAATLTKAMLNCEFIITLHVVERYMFYSESVTRCLQARALDIV